MYKKLVLKNLLATLRAAEGSKMWQNLYLSDKNGVEFDAVGGGEHSCALFASSILAAFGLIDASHATVKTTVIKLQEAGWVKISTPQVGALVEYPEKDGHPHIGFVIGENEVISNNSELKVPKTHQLTMDDGRQPIAFWWHEQLTT